MEGQGPRRPRFQPPQQPPQPSPQPQPQNMDPNLMLLQNLGFYLQNNPLLPFNTTNNPYFLQNANIRNQNPNFPIQNPTPHQNPFPLGFQNPNLSTPPQQSTTSTQSQQNPSSSYYVQQNDKNPSNFGQKQQQQQQQQQRQNPKFPVQQKPVMRSDRKEMLEKIEAAIVSARRELIAAGENVSVWKVSQSALVKLQADSWDSLGFQPQEVPVLRHLMLTEGKINAFIHCYVAIQRITSLFDLQAAICKNEGIETFEELELGPFVRHPLVLHYFSVNKDITGVYKITTEEIVLYLSEFFNGRKRKNVKIEDFLDFIAKKSEVASWQQLGVRIQSLGMYIALLREAHTSRDLVLKKCMETVKARCSKPKKKRPLFSLEKKELDDRFTAMTQRVTSFASVNKDFSGKHVRFASSSSEDDGAIDSSDSEEKGDNNYAGNQCQLPSVKSRGGDKVSNCPYPSVAEEMKRLGLRGETYEYSSPGRQSLSSSKIGEPLKKKRKLKNQIQGEAIEKNSLFKLGDAHTGEKQDQTNVDVSLENDSIRMFITTWKEACREHTAGEVFEKMLEFYGMSARQRKRLRSAFSSYPLVGLLNVAVTSIKNGMWDSMYDTFQFMGELGQANPCADEHTEYESIDVEPVEKDRNRHNKGALEPGTCVDQEDIVAKALEYLADSPMLSGGNSLLDKLLRFAGQLSCCEVWLAQQFSVEEFRSLGHGDFWSFAGQHVSLIPKELLECLKDEAQGPQSLEVCMLQQQLDTLLAQASGSLWEDDGVTKEKISELLMRQFPFISFKITVSGRVVQLSDAIDQLRTNSISNCVLFSATLLGTSNYADSAHFNERDVSSNFGLVADVAQTDGKLGLVTSRDAMEVLLRAPFLSDLISWSHWDLLYAPSLGPLLQWLLTDVNAKDFLCLLTQNGRIIRIDHSASQDLFFQAILQESPFEIAVQLLSLFALHGGRRHLPLALLKCQARQAFEVIMGSSICNMDIKDDPKFEKTSSKPLFEKSSGCDWSANKSKSLSGVNRAVAAVSRIFIDCLGFLPSEFRCFAADMLLSGLQCVVKDIASAVLLHCRGIEEHLMVHEIGLSLGIVEWIHDHHARCPITKGDSSMSTGSSSSSSVDPDVIKELRGVHCPPDRVPSPSTNKDEQCMVRSDTTALNGCPNADGPVKVTSQHSADKDTNENMEAALVIESIRREEFGLDPSISDVESDMLKKQHARLGRALHCLSQELYSQDSHFLLELVQNADDNAYPENVEPTLTFILQHTGIVVLNNERGFTAQNIKALCDVGNSTKKGSSAGYIGQKGIGFKSVFRVTDAPEIHSNGFHIKFDITEGQIGFVLPTIVPPCNIEMFKQLASASDIRKGGNCWNTCIVLPFKSKLREGSAMSSILSMFSDLHPSLLLFLHRLQCIKLKNMLSDTLVIMRKEILGDGIVRVSHGEEKMTWFVISNKLHPKVLRPNVQMTEISIALTLKETQNGDYEPFLDQQPVFAFLPLRTYGLKFILQADFVLPSSREEVDGDSPWNQWLLSEFPALFVAAQKSFCALPCFQNNPAKAVTFYMSFVPLMGEVHGFFSGLPRMIISKLRQSNCLLKEGHKDKWVPPCKVLRGWNEQAQLLLSDSLLHEHLGLILLEKDISLSDSLARALGIVEYGPKILVQFISSVGHIKDGIRSMGFGWLFAWLNELYNMLHSYAPHLRNSGVQQDLLDSLRRVPFIPLSDGTYSSLDEGSIWFHADCAISSTDAELGNDAFSHLYATLRIVSPLLFSEASNDASSINNCTRMLQIIGVQKLSAHELIRTHILPSISCGKLSDEDHQLMIEYIAFVMLHLDSNCVNCLVEKEPIMSELRSNAPILTNQGYKRPTEVSIHFSRELGNSVDVKKLMQSLDYKWHEVDIAYLKHPVTSSMSCGWMKWREFLQKLGVTDFVRAVAVEKSVADLSSTVLNQMMCDRHLISSGLVVKDWESPELVHILSLLSKDGCQERSKYFLEVLDALWDDNFSDKVSGCCSRSSDVYDMFFKSSLMNSLTDIKWVASSLDKELHYPGELFYDCDAVRSLLGCHAPYAVPKIRSTKLLTEIGFKTQVTLDDALAVLKIWQRLESPFKASILQMSKLYAFIWKEMAKSREQVLDALCSGPFIFVPYSSVKLHEDVVTGMFLSPEEVYWNDSTGALDCSLDVDFSVETRCSLFSKTLCTVYPGLHDFFVKECGVNEAPPLHQYLQILQQLSRKALPTEAAHVVFQVLLKWSDGLKCGALNSDDLHYLKEHLMRSEFTVLPATQDKWVSLHPSFGLVCWCDDDILKKEFKHSDNIEFLYFGELTNNEKEMLQTRVSLLLQNLGIRALSEVASREPIYYGAADCGFKSSMVAWVLPFAQRYVYNLHPDKYDQLKLSGLSELHQLKLVVVEKLFYHNVIKRCDCASKRRFECSSLLQGNILYTTQESDSHSLFMELSRLFFDGRPELHLANFLCMITTMVESGSTEEQIEFFILNSQKMTKLPEDEPVWSLSSLVSSPENDEFQEGNSSPMTIGDPISSKSKKAAAYSSWPPTDWKTAPGFNYSRTHGIRTQPAITDQGGSLGKHDEISECFIQDKADLTLTEINEDAIIEDGVIDPDSTLILPLESQADQICNQPQSSTEALADPTNIVVESVSPEESQSKSNGKDRLLLNTPDAQQARLTGKLGELVAFRYFSGKVGGEAVNWVNQDGETGLPYDIVVGQEEEGREYIEVKASRYAKKDWFVISTREWQFAAEKGSSFSIAHVIIPGQNLAKVTVYKNPVKLCQLGKLQLAVMIPKSYQEPPQ